MAAQAAIDAVKLQVPDEAEELGFDDTDIGILIDSGLSQSRTILAVFGNFGKSVELRRHL